ncbi:MAG: TRAP transporter large permease [Lautropia sp.]
MSAIVISGILIASLFALLAVGVWVGIALAVVGGIAFVFFGTSSFLDGLSVSLWGALDSWELAALPLFVWMGEILFRTRLSEQMFDGLAPWVERLPGRLMHVNVIASGLFGSVCGSTAATTATVSKAALPELRRLGYDEKLCLGSLCGSGTLGILIPPSVTMIIFAVAADVPLIELFAAGLVPAAILMALFMSWIGWRCLRDPRLAPDDGRRSSWAIRLRALRQLLPVIVLILFVLGLMGMGYATATESAAFGVLGSLIIAAAGRSLTWAAFRDSLLGTTKVSAMIMLIIAGAAFLTKAMAFTGIPRGLAEWVNAQGFSPSMLILALAIVYIVLGTALDGVSMIVLTAAVVIPMVQSAGINLVWFGIFIVLMVEMSEITPPVGFCLFILQSMSGRDSNFVAMAAMPFFFILAATVVIITAFPGLVMWLPDLIR